MANHTLRIALTDSEEELIRWLAKRDGVTLLQELKQCIYCEVDQLVTLYYDEMREDKGDVKVQRETETVHLKLS